MQGPQVRSLVVELDPAHMLQLRVRVPQLKIPSAATKTRCSLNKFKICIYIDPPMLTVCPQHNLEEFMS